MRKRILSVRRPLTALGTAIASLLASSGTLDAQQPNATDANRGMRLAVGGGISHFDLSGVGTAPAVFARAEVPLGRIFLIEPGVTYLRPDQQFGFRSNFVVGEVQFQAQAPFGQLAPYIGAGVGRALDLREKENGGSIGRLSLSGALGLRFQAASRVALRSELRGHAFGREFTASMAIWSLGIAWRL